MLNCYNVRILIYHFLLAAFGYWIGATLARSIRRTLNRTNGKKKTRYERSSRRNYNCSKSVISVIIKCYNCLLN